MLYYSQRLRKPTKNMEEVIIMKKNIEMLDLNNGDVFIKFGADYAHCYFKGNLEQITEDINSFESDSDTSSWDNNEIDYWNGIFDDETVHLTTLEEIKNWNK